MYEPARTTRSCSRSLISLPLCNLQTAAIPAFCFAALGVWNDPSEDVKSSASMRFSRATYVQ